jgi:hypothetical protein
MKRTQLEYKVWRCSNDLRLVVNRGGVNIWSMYKDIHITRREARALAKKISQALEAWAKAKE